MHRYDESKMYTHLSGFCKGARMTSSLKALGVYEGKTWTAEKVKRAALYRSSAVDG